MTNNDAKKVIEAAGAGPAAGASAAAAAAATEDRPRRRKKRKYSKRLRRVQEAERGVSKALHRLVRSAEAGVGKWRDATDRSSRKRRDGAIRDALENFGKATSKTIRTASKTPEDLMKAVRKLKVGKVSKFVRRIIPL